MKIDETKVKAESWDPQPEEYLERGRNEEFRDGVPSGYSVDELSEPVGDEMELDDGFGVVDESPSTIDEPPLEVIDERPMFSEPAGNLPGKYDYAPSRVSEETPDPMLTGPSGSYEDEELGRERDGEVSELDRLKRWPKDMMTQEDPAEMFEPDPMVDPGYDDDVIDEMAEEQGIGTIPEEAQDPNEMFEDEVGMPTLPEGDYSEAPKPVNIDLDAKMDFDQELDNEMDSALGEDDLDNLQRPEFTRESIPRTTKQDRRQSVRRAV